VDNDKGNQRQDQSATPSIITCDPFLGELIQKAKKLADSDIPVLISGESGTGKELMAHLIHNNSQCQSREFFQINCASFQDNLLESELFGHVKGAFTGATKDKKGIFELADRSSIHLDEIGDMTLATQAKVLRVLQEGDLKKVGAERVSKVKIRVIASTNKNLAQEVEAGRFRRDLYYRLKGAHLQLPPLKERRCDISQLCEYFVSRHRSSPLTINPGVIDMLKEHHWPGNIRELSHVLHYACTVCQGETLGVEDLPPELFEKQDLVPQSTLETKPTQPKNTPQEHGLLDEAERLAIEDAYRKNGFNKKKTALELGISRGTLYSRLKKYNLG
jgi:transcriptional regulator with PAS, ATPase and Fis domain